eukprot:TRINITY_DN80020_c0_g1_i1.p1 TRINITY_DN80020_c0_g1~~TRINITY_DN80020_c0_g1_i1.p1  ORF type:complete len:384 (-),score=73.00 TRINITY_DN80020_c0_g1_i1:52-1203(-)
MSGLQLLLALIPHSDPRWQREALGNEDCEHLVKILQGSRARGGYFPEANSLTSSLLESRKRLWLFFRLLHLSAAIPTEVQGQLVALADNYLRPILIEQRVPLELRSYGPDALLDASKAEVSEAQNKALALSGKNAAARIGNSLGSSPNHEQSRLQAEKQQALQSPRADSETGSADSGGTPSFCATSMASGSNASTSRQSFERKPGDVGKALKKLTATRSDIARVLGRLPAASLLGQSACSAEAEKVLTDIFTSIVLSVPSTSLGLTSNQANRAASQTVAIATGYRFGSKPYVLRGVSTNLELLVAVVSREGDVPREISIALCEMCDEEPAVTVLTDAWRLLSSALPRSFNEALLKIRRQKLRRAKEAIRTISRSRSYEGSTRV